MKSFFQLKQEDDEVDEVRSADLFHLNLIFVNLTLITH